MSKLRIGVIGAGGIPTAHLPHLQARSDAVELVAVADINEAAAATTAEKYGIARPVTDYQDLLPDVDAVLICVPTYLHAEIAVTALDAGKHVFCEKPMARTLEQAEAMMAAAGRSGKGLQFGFVRRFDDDWMTWRGAVQAGKIGRPVVWRHVMASAGAPTRWFSQEEQGGGPFLDGCIHNIDFGLYTFGPVEWVFAHARTLNPNNTALDTGTATIHFASGDELLLAWSWGLPKGCSGTGVFEFLGPQGIMNSARGEGAEGRYIINHGESKEEVTFPAQSIHEAFRRQMDEFIAVARGEAKPRAGGREGYESLHVALAILQSGRTTEVVRL